MRRGKSGRELLLSFKVEPEAKIEAKSLALLDENWMTSELFTIGGTDALSLFRNRLEVLHKSRNPICLLLMLAWTARA